MSNTLEIVTSLDLEVGEEMTIERVHNGTFIIEYYEVLSRGKLFRGKRTYLVKFKFLFRDPK
jgi:hypothetical protein